MRTPMPAFVMGFVVLALTTPGDAMVVRAPTARRKWGALVEGTLGELAGRQRKQLNNLVQRAGGRDGVISALAAVPAAIKADTEKLLDRLASIFHLSDDEFTVLGTAFWLVSGGPAVELETDLFGGMHFVHGTHMRSWWWIRYFVQHPKLKCSLGESMVYALCLIAMLTCGPSVWRRICRQARKMLWESGIVTMLEALWQVDARKVICRDATGGDTSTLSLNVVKGNKGRYYVRKAILGAKWRFYTVHSVTSFDDARNYIINEELPRRLAFVKRMMAWSTIHKRRLSFTPERVLSLHGNMPSKSRMLKSECLHRSTTDPLSPFASRRDKADKTTYSGNLNTPWAKAVFKLRVRSRGNADKLGNNGR